MVEPARVQVSWYRRPWAWMAAAVPVLAGLALLVLMPRQAEGPKMVAMAKPPAELQRIAVDEKPVENLRPAEPMARRVVAPAAVQENLVQEKQELSRKDASANAPSPKETSSGEARASAETREAARQNAMADAPLVAGRMEQAAPGAAAPAPPPQAAPKAVAVSQQQTGVAAPPAAPAAVRERPVPATGSYRPANSLPASNEQQPVTLTVLVRGDSSTQWAPLESEIVPAGAAVRLRLSAPQTGTLRVAPGNRLVVLNDPAVPLDVDLGALPAGEHTITATFVPGTGLVGNAFGGSRLRMAEADAKSASEKKSFSQAGSAAPVTFTRKFTVR